MSVNRASLKWVWLSTGLVAGICIASIWPHEPLSAATADRNEKFGLITARVTVDSEAVFVIDYLTGRLSGALLQRTRGATAFVNFFYRNLAEDFKVGASSTPYYAVSSGIAEIPNSGGSQWGQSALYVAELTSGKVAAYAIPFQITQRKLPPQPLAPIDAFPFREATVTQ
jgi:hypothetical protein